MLPEDVKNRIVEEQKELRVKIYKLAEFVYSDKFYSLGMEQRFLLRKQLQAMEEYDEILSERLEDDDDEES